MEHKGQHSGPKQGVGEYAMELIRQGLTNVEVVERVLAEFPTAKTSMASVNWYRTKMRSNGEPIFGNRELKKRRDATQE